MVCVSKKVRNCLFPPNNMANRLASVQLSIVKDRVTETLTPKPRWRPAHWMQCKLPCWTSAQSGSAALQSKHKSLPGTHLIFSMAFGGSGWAGGLREVRGFALAVDMARVPHRRASLSDKWANAPPFVFGLGASVDWRRAAAFIVMVVRFTTHHFCRRQCPLKG